MQKLGFGTMRLPLTDETNQKSIDMKAYCGMVDIFMENGFSYFDTAYMYHEYESENALREAVVRRYPREAFTVASKLPLSLLQRSGDNERIFVEQLKKCGISHFDYYMLHNINSVNYKTAQKFNCFEYISELKASGKVRSIGFSYHDNSVLLDEVLTSHPEVDFVQLQLNYLDWDNSGIQSKECYKTAQKHNKKVIVMEPVKGGTLADIPADALETLRKVRPEMSAASWAIRFAASLDGVMCVLSGMSDMKQMLDNVSFMRDFTPLCGEEYSALKRAVGSIAEARIVPCTACRYCVEGCPKKIAIPEYFALYNAEKESINKGFSTQGVYYANLALSHGKASECVSCRLCEKACPQHIEISRFMRDVAATFEKQ